MKAKLIVIVESHLSDVLIDMTLDKETAKQRVRFLKWLLLRNRDLNQEIDPEEAYEIYDKENNQNKINF